MHGALAMSSAVAAAFFVRFWKSGHDRLFLFFSLAFAIFAVDWVGLGLVGVEAETRHYWFVVRLFAFVLIIIGIVDKNRRSVSQ
jgi:uncharacterized membrane protein